MLMFVLKKTVAERSPESHGKLLRETFGPALKLDVSHSTQANAKSGTVCQYIYKERCKLR